ncbi:diguanylate cyclase domain-containing protein [Vreelandella sulfidaeris]|uniref:diguanylate cyclase domain-containing protein n=1 Tax=Vreelandella sulfidaeris TaxID=115553 RepID=UPI0035F058DC
MTQQSSRAGEPQNKPAHAKHLCDEKLHFLFYNVWQPVVAGILGAFLLAIIMWGMVDSVVLVGWLIAMLLVSALRLLLARHFLRVSALEKRHPRWLRLFTLAVFLTGCVWGMGGFLMFDSDNPAQSAALAIVLAGVAAGCVTMLSSLWWMVLFFILPIAIPLQLLFIFSDTPAHTMIGVLVGLFVLLLIATSHRLGRVIHDNLELRILMAAREAQLLESENRYLSIFQHSPLGVIHFDKQGCITDCNEKLLEILALDRSTLIDLCLPQGADIAMATAAREALAKGSGYYEGNFATPWLSQPTKGVPVRAFFNGVRSVDNEIVGGVAIIEDFTERKRSEEIIFRQAYYDALTDLPNRRLFMERLEATCQAKDNEQHGLVMFMDLDRFKLINDTLGHAAGDDLLVQISRRLERCLQKGDMAARLSGDEFVLLADVNVPDRDSLDAMAETYMQTIQKALSGQYHLDSHCVEVTPSMGYTCFDAKACDYTEVLKQADIAMYQAKIEGRARLHRYQPWMSEEVEKRIAQQAPGFTAGR